MVRLKQHLPSSEIQSLWPNIKLYTWALWSDIHTVLDSNGLENFKVPQVMDIVDPLQRLTIVRHLESKYNQYKEAIRSSDLYSNFTQEVDPVKKKQYALDLLADFRQQVWVDYTTDVSMKGHDQGEKYSALYSELIKKHPTLFPTMIVVSPYLRTRITAHYFLKNVVGLDMDVDKLIDKDSIDDMMLWSFQGKDIVLQLGDEVRERDHGSDVAPSYLRKYINSFSEFNSLSWLPGDDIEQMYYYTSDGGGESQTQVNQRAKTHFNSLTSEYLHKDIMVFSHHLYVLWWLNSIFKWTYRTFKHFDTYRKPLNGSINIFSKIPQTQMWQENKLRVAWYNLMLDD